MSRRVGDWMRVRLGDEVVDLDDERHTGTVEGIKHSSIVTVRWHGTGYLGEVALHRVKVVKRKNRNVLHRSDGTKI